MDSRNYILEHWNEYNLTDTRAEFIALLNILDAHGETIDSLHAVALNGEDLFCGIYHGFENDRDTVSTLFEYNQFIADAWEIQDIIETRLADYTDAYGKEEADTEIKAMYCDDIYCDELITRTTDGYVYTYGC